MIGGVVFLYKYFSMLADSVQGIEPYKSIKDLTIDIAKSGGYSRELYVFKNGAVRERTLYTKKFDSTLVSLWMLHYKHLFISKLMSRKDLIDYHVNIINNTFFIVMGCLNLDKVLYDNTINLYVNLSLNSRIKEISKRVSSRFYYEPYKKGTKYPFVQKDAVINQAVSLDDLIENCGYDIEDNCFFDDIEADLRNKLSSNIFGDKVLNFLLLADKKVNYKDIDKKLGMKADECTDESRKLITDAINMIRETLLAYVDTGKRFRRIAESSITFSLE